ncbi:MAG TPA: hypothetical protein VFD70_15780 [Anaerolineae bacterium]|nr:hypothetical protein [Anaerolineae bacterium]
MEPIPVTATELRTRTRELIERVHFYRECYRVETFGRPMVVIISCEDFQEIQALLEGNAPSAPLFPGNENTSVRRKELQSPRKKRA